MTQRPQAWVDRDALAKWFLDERAKEREGCFSTCEYCDDTLCICKDWSYLQANALLASGLISRKPSEEEAAKALLFEESSKSGVTPWTDISPGYRDVMLRKARAVLSAKSGG